MREILIPGGGWDTESVITGFIKLRWNSVSASVKTIADFEFDEVYPFTNIFHAVSPAAYSHPVVGFAGSYKQIEEDWPEWLWRFGQLLNQLDATEAHVNLTCIIGDYHWKMEPRLRFENRCADECMIGQIWGITDEPKPDFSTDPEWTSHFCQDRAQHFTERWRKSA